jgi:choline dehydrogenase-like flavoprotein
VGERRDGTLETFRLRRVFIAAGAINSTRLVLESKGLFDRVVPMKSTQGFVVPMLSLFGAPFRWPETNTLTGMFFEFRVPRFPDHWVHTQINAANDLVLARLDYDPQRRSPKDRLLKMGLRRLLVGLCNFHSDCAGGYELTLRSGKNGGRSILNIEVKPSTTHERISKLGAKRLLSLLSRVGVYPLLPFKLGDPGKPASWHFGGTLPMSKNPQGELSTDVMGRPRGWERVHIVDDSVFPSIPSTTVALLSMANAARIAHTADLD